MFTKINKVRILINVGWTVINLSLLCRSASIPENRKILKERPSYCNTPGAALLNAECGKGSSPSYGNGSAGSTTPSLTSASTNPTTGGTTFQSTTIRDMEVTSTTEISPEFNGAPFVNYFGIAFSPYVVKGAPFNSYSLEDIKRMLRILETYHNSISTYGVGVAGYNKDNAWDQANSNCLIARAAAMINNEGKGFKFSVAQGVNQHKNSQELQTQEIENAFLAVTDANRIAPYTVWALVFTNEYIDKCEDCGQRVLDMIKNNKERANEMRVRVGTRIQICDQIHGGPYQETIKEIIKESDFIMCNLYPPANSNNTEKAVRAISKTYFSICEAIWEVNPHVEVIIGETGWASEGSTFNNPAEFNTIEKQKEFWMKMKNWAVKNAVKVQMFEGFDEPWKPEGETKFGWWYKEENGTKYIEKATGEDF